MRYVVVENAGYERETDIDTAHSWREAMNRIDEIYEPFEVDELHVAVCIENPDGSREYI